MVVNLKKLNAIDRASEKSESLMLSISGLIGLAKNKFTRLKVEEDAQKPKKLKM